MFRPGEVRDLQRIAAGWGVPLATVVWVIVHDQLARWRKKAPELGPHGLAITAAGIAVTRGVTERRRGGVGAGG